MKINKQSLYSIYGLLIFLSIFFLWNITWVKLETVNKYEKTHNNSSMDGFAIIERNLLTGFYRITSYDHASSFTPGLQSVYQVTHTYMFNVRNKIATEDRFNFRN